MRKLCISHTVSHVQLGQPRTQGSLFEVAARQAQSIGRYSSKSLADDVNGGDVLHPLQNPSSVYYS
jgi:hypothetical protein